MVVFEFIGELLTMIFVEIIFKGIILGALKLFNKGVNYIKHNILGLKLPKNEKNLKTQLEKKLLYKKIELTQKLNSILKKGQQGVVLEIIYKDTVFAEFYDQDNQQIEIDNELVFEVRMNQFRLSE